MLLIIKNILISLFVLLLVNAGSSNAQINLVPNPSFEVFDTCPSNSRISTGPYLSIYYAVPWFQPNINDNSTDYFNACDTNSNFLSVPDNYEDYQIAKTGVAYAGFVLGRNNPPNNYREYLEVKLTDSLLANKKYCVSFFISFSNISTTAIDRFGAYFSKNGVYNSDFTTINLSPQIENVQGNIIDDTLNWIEISGEFFPAGGERYLTIGNFYSDPLTNYHLINLNGSHGYCYYYIDDVSVVLCDSSVGINENLIRVNDVVISPNPSNDYFEISFLEKSTFSGLSIYIYSIDGKMLKSFNHFNNNSQINVVDLNAGVYLVKLRFSNGKILNKRLVITR